MSKIDDWAPRIRGPRELAAYDGSTTDAERRAKRLDAIAKAAYNNLRAYSNCCRSTLWALQTHLRLGGDDPLKASATLAGGIAGTGETCGAVIGALMGLGLGIASADVQELDRYVAAETPPGGSSSGLPSGSGALDATSCRKRSSGGDVTTRR
jgi:hypothetical protein